METTVSSISNQIPFLVLMNPFHQQKKIAKIKLSANSQEISLTILNKSLCCEQSKILHDIYFLKIKS